MQVASRVMEQVNAHNPDAVFIDGTGIGWGVVRPAEPARLLDLARRRFRRPGRPHRRQRRRRALRQQAGRDVGLHEGVVQGRAACPTTSDLIADLGDVDYGYDAADAILLERKDDMRRRGLASPDDGDALALTFAYPVAKRDWAEERRFDEGLARLKRWVR